MSMINPTERVEINRRFSGGGIGPRLVTADATNGAKTPQKKERSLPLRKLNKCRQEYRLYRRLDCMANSPYDHHSSTFPHCHTSGNVSSAFSGLLVPVWILGCSLTMLGSLSKSKIRYQLT